MKRVFNLSGGKTSAYMTISEKPNSDDIVLFTDTGREHPLTYKFLDDIEKNEGFKIHRATYVHRRSPNKTGFDAMTHWKSYLPNRVRRICTAELKINTARRYLKPFVGRRFEQYIGFRYDEPERVKKFRSTYKNTVTRFPLYDKKITKPMIDHYWGSKPYTLEIPSILGNCDLCFLKGKNNLIKIMAKYPELADKWIEDERRSAQIRGKKGGTFFKDTTYEELLKVAKSQLTLFDLEEALPAYSCSCTT
ncbi:phosphoadenosine phosphosulfate reductase family protein [Pedobacter sp. ASV28]|uniref:phosphoadenosine phosphosulfate reductase domain-containing protein n=1 Tax=Pedobacter sp. ASV28 TaxID=2795123 RepID=UPI0018EC7A31|nr:phosphoadenosine phosphosulfate reductase family protein [Pedobacter sp. ASV28]